jgi:hypothetical protein
MGFVLLGRWEKVAIEGRGTGWQEAEEGWNRVIGGDN